MSGYTERTARGANIRAVNTRNADAVEGDWYATHPSSVEALLEVEQFGQDVLEPCVGGGNIARVLEAHGHRVTGWDIADRGWPGTEVHDFLSMEGPWDGDVVTNPPYRLAKEFVEQSLGMVAPGRKVAMLLKLTFLESQKRWPLFRDNPPARVWVFRERQECGANGVFTGASSAVCYAWFVWSKGYKGSPEVRWL